jgi:hypothetical protein
MIEVLRMYKSILNKLLTCSLLFWLAGCAENKYAKTIEQLCPPDANKTAAMTTAERVLVEMYFHIEKFDVDAGYIRTAPLSGAQSFEFWRSDNVGSFNQTEADLHSIRRAVEINISEQTGRSCINCRATTQRLSIPQSPAVSDQHTIMSHEQKDVKKPKITREQKATLAWTDLGRDNQLETEILKRIESRLTADKKQLAAAKKESNK